MDCRIQSDQLVLAGRDKQPSDFTLFRPAPVVETVALPVFGSAIRCGFPSPADDYLESRLDLNDLILHREATFFARVEGDSMVGLGIAHGDLLMIDRAIQPEVGDIVVAEVAGEFTVKRLEVHQGRGYLVAANPTYQPIPVCPEQGVQVWGVVLHVIKSVRVRRRRK